MQAFNIPKFADFDICFICETHNGPFCWVTIKGNLRFVCEDCYKKFFKYSTDAVLEKIKKRG